MIFLEVTDSKKCIWIEITTCRFRYFNDDGMLTQLVSQADSCDVILGGCCLVNLSLPGTPDHHDVPEVNQLWWIIVIHWWLHTTSSAESENDNLAWLKFILLSVSEETNNKSQHIMYKCTPGVRATTPKMTDDAMFLNHRFIFQSPHKVPWRRASTKYGKRKNPWLHNSTFRLKAKNIGSYVTT